MRIGDLLSMLKLAHHHARMYAYLAGKRIDPQLRVQRMNPGDEASQPLLIHEEIDSEQVGSLLGVWLLLEPLRVSTDKLRVHHRPFLAVSALHMSEFVHQRVPKPIDPVVS